jgi:hypothetical protein
MSRMFDQNFAFSVFGLHDHLFVSRDHRNPRMHRAENLAVGFSVQSISEPAQTLVQRPPVRDAGDDR